MQRLILPLLISLLLLLPAGVNPDTKTRAQANAPLVLVLEIADDIKAGTALEIDRAVARAEREDADYLIIKLDTPGGLLSSTRQIVNAILGAEAEVVVYAHNPGGWALSAGAIIMLAADISFIHPEASIGAAQPFTPGESNDIQDEKALLATASWVRSLAEVNNRDADTAERFVTQNLTLGGQEAREANVVDHLASSQEEVLELLGVSDARIEELEPTIAGAIFNTLSHPHLVSLFLTLGGLALIMAIRSGEFMFSTAVGAILLLVGLWGVGIIEFSYIGLGLLLLGVILLMVELFDEPGFGLFGAGGIVAIFFGIVSLSQEPFYAPRLGDAVSLAVLATLLLMVLLLGFVSRAIAGSLKSKTVTGSEALAGKTATVVRKLDPKGRVELEGESWPARLEDETATLAKNRSCSIIKVKGNTLIVKPEE